MSDPCPFGDEDRKQCSGVHAGSFKFTQPLRDLGIGGGLSRLAAFHFRYYTGCYGNVRLVPVPIQRVTFRVRESCFTTNSADSGLSAGANVTRPTHGVSCSRYGLSPGVSHSSGGQSGSMTPHSAAAHNAPSCHAPALMDASHRPK